MGGTKTAPLAEKHDAETNWLLPGLRFTTITAKLQIPTDMF
jgi:hypothetical protein